MGDFSFFPSPKKEDVVKPVKANVLVDGKLATAVVKPGESVGITADGKAVQVFDQWGNPVPEAVFPGPQAGFKSNFGS